MNAHYCPSCGTQRTGDLRFCASCQFDFGPDAPAAGPPAPATPAAAPVQAKHGGFNPLAVILFLILVGIGGAVVVNLAKDGSVASVNQSEANVPPSGQIWFGPSFDPSTLALSSRVTSVTGSGAFSAVAHLPRSMNGSDLSLREYFNGELITSGALNWSGSGEFWGWSAAPLFAPGSWRFDLVDVGGNILASGTIQDN